MESIFSVDRTFIHASVAELQPLDGHLQFVRSAGPVIFTSICQIFQLYLLILVFAFAAKPAAVISVKLCRHFVDDNSPQTDFSLYL